MDAKPNILVVCGRNKRRSRSAEYIFKNDQRINIRSVGLSPKSNREIKEKDIEWADLILVMDQEQRARIRDTFRQITVPRIEVLHVPDNYEYLDQDVLELLADRINATLRSVFNI